RWLASCFGAGARSRKHQVARPSPARHPLIMQLTLISGPRQRHEGIRHMKLVTSLLLTCSTLIAVPALAADEAEDQGGREILVTAYGLEQESAAATGLSLTLRETPQSVTIVDRERIEAFQ